MVEELTLEQADKQFMKSPPPYVATEPSRKPKHNQESAWGRIKAVMTDTGLETTAHGIPNMISNTMWSFKLMWIVCFLASCAGCAYLLYKSTKDYLDYEVVTTIKKISESPTIFPTVTLCNRNLIVNQAMKDYVVQHMMMDPLIFATSVVSYDYIR